MAYLKRTKIGSAVGTPGRLGKLLNEKGKTSTQGQKSLINPFMLRCPQRVGPFSYYFGYYVQRYNDSKFAGYSRNEG